MDDIIAKYWAPIWALVSTAITLIMILLGKTYAKKEVVEEMQRKMDHLNGRMNDLPTRSELHDLHLEIANLRGDLKELSPRLDRVQHMSDLLLENELKERA
ncbi:DUF2730 family protein [Oceanospirillum multiglobuliferum]|uniref:DUF2730 domain-containing protein n=1 Tax=Oceanospirillum multiglobuliferum TaxID=64969 RepID=A0A1V4T9Z3_9GAMM|nr:DUF2730 family protein [Oceanospirillum multiglobuliferum]OPX57059.1 hypothetical protein BTE48_01110 [Oceanospirillum multiglobuliferum]